MKRVFFGIFVALAGLVVLLAGTLAVRHVRQKEWVPPDVAVNLESKWPVLPEADVKPDSAFGLLRRAAEAQARVPKSDEVRKEMSRLYVEPWSNELLATLKGVLDQSGEALALARSAATAANPQVPTYTTISQRFDYLSGLMRLNDTFQISSAEKAAAGDVAGAFDDLETAVNDAQILSRGGPLIHLLLDITFEMRACRAMRLLSLQHEVPPKVTSRAIQQLQATTAAIEPLDETIRQEYHAIPNIVELLFNPSGPSMIAFDDDAAAAEHRMRWLFKWFGWTVGSTRPEVERDLTRLYKAAIATVSKPYHVQQMQYLEEGIIPKLERADLFLYRDPAGYVVAKTTAPMFGGVTSRFHRRALDLNATIAFLAARQFQQTEHRAPVSLEELVPQYLSTVPNDPFDGKPLKYRIGTDRKWVVYSVGPNQLDEGGNRPKSEPRSYTDAGDIIFSESDLAWERERLKAKDKKS